jgi:hypothetical protein
VTETEATGATGSDQASGGAREPALRTTEAEKLEAATSRIPVGAKPIQAEGGADGSATTPCRALSSASGHSALYRPAVMGAWLCPAVEVVTTNATRDSASRAHIAHAVRRGMSSRVHIAGPDHMRNGHGLQGLVTGTRSAQRRWVNSWSSSGGYRIAMSEVGTRSKPLPEGMRRSRRGCLFGHRRAETTAFPFLFSRLSRDHLERRLNRFPRTRGCAGRSGTTGLFRSDSDVPFWPPILTAARPLCR